MSGHHPRDQFTRVIARRCRGWISIADLALGYMTQYADFGRVVPEHCEEMSERTSMISIFGRACVSESGGDSRALAEPGGSCHVHGDI